MRTLRIFTRTTDLDGQPTKDLDDLASTTPLAAPPGSARARLYRD